jgi:putative oxidoreductase
MKTETVSRIFWVIRILLALVFVVAGVPKLIGNIDVVNNFHRWGYSDGFRLFTGAVEMAGGVGLLLKPSSLLAAGGLIGVMIGAAFTHVTHAEWPMLGLPAVILVLLVLTFGHLLRARRSDSSRL